MGVKERKLRQKKFLRQEILDAARELFVKEGYENVSMRRIAEKIEYSPTTIYLYFEDKASLLFAICEETFAKLARRMESIISECSDPLEALRKGCRAYVDFGLKYPNHYKVTFMNQAQLDPGSMKYMREGSMGFKCYSILRGNVERCIREKKLKDYDIEAMTQAIWAGGHGLVSLLIAKPDFPWANRNKLIELMISSMVDGLRA